MAEVFGQYKDIQRRRPDLSKARRLLGYEPKTSLEDLCRMMVEADLRRNQAGSSF